MKQWGKPDGQAVVRALTWEAGAVWWSVRRAFTDAGPERDTAVQSLKAAAAAVLAWAVAGWWWDAPMALMAPWTALFLMHSTVYRSLLSAFQQFVVVLIGTLIAAGAAVLTHNAMAAMALALPLTVLLGNYARLGTHGLYAPTAALFVLAYGSYTGYDIVHRLLETLLGAGIGVAVNALVLPPVHGRRVGRLRAQLPDGCAELLYEAADGVSEGYGEDDAHGWYEKARRLTDVVADLRDTRRWSDESYRVNPGRRMRRGPAVPPAGWEFAWDQVTENTVTTMRTLADAARRPVLPSGVPDALSAVLRAAGDVCRCGDPDHAREGGVDGQQGERRRALARASAAHRRLRTLYAARDVPLTSTAGAVLADTRRLLTALLRVSDPTAATAPAASADRAPRQHASR
ncbi:aromatic acid exporter family protein [Streptomyces sp. NPDC059785]|uniref:FUSC family protein n=1 Tax=unclassified Streptomyces TaxID=2593676 RepID=UPI003649BA1D